MVFGMPRALFPALAERLGGGPALYGLLLSAVAAGAFIASLASGWTSRIQRQGSAVLVSVTAWGVRIAAGRAHRVGAAVVLACWSAPVRRTWCRASTVDDRRRHHARRHAGPRERRGVRRLRGRARAR